MPKINIGFDLSNINDQEKFANYCGQIVDNLLSVINGKLEFDSNLATQTLKVTFVAANSDVVITHKLNKTGVNFDLINKPVSCDVYHGSNQDTNSSIVLKCTQATTVTLRLS